MVFKTSKSQSILQVNRFSLIKFNQSQKQNQQEQSLTMISQKSEQLPLISHSGQNQINQKPLSNTNQIVPEISDVPIAEQQMDNTNHISQIFEDNEQMDEIMKFFKKQAISQVPKIEERNHEFLESVKQFENLNALISPLNVVELVQVIGLPSYPDLYLKVSKVSLAITQKGTNNIQKQKRKITEQSELSPEEIAFFINLEKTSKHCEYEARTVSEGPDHQGIISDITDIPQLRFQSNNFTIFEVYQGEMLVNECVLYDWELFKYKTSTGQDCIRISIDKFDSKKKLYFFGIKKEEFKLFIMDESKLATPQNFDQRNPTKLEDIAKPLKLNNLDPKSCCFLEIVGDKIIWQDCVSELVLISSLEEKSEQKKFQYSSGLFIIPLDVNKQGEQAKFFDGKEAKIVYFNELQPHNEQQKQQDQSSRVLSQFYTESYIIRLWKRDSGFQLYYLGKEGGKRSIQADRLIDWLQIGSKLFILGHLSKGEDQNYQISIWEFSEELSEIQFQDKKGSTLIDFNLLPNLKKFSFKIPFDADIKSFRVSMVNMKDDILTCRLDFYANGVEQILLVNASSVEKTNRKSFQLNIPSDGVVQYPFKTTIMPFHNAIIISVLDTNQPQMYLTFTDRKVVFLAENIELPQIISVLLQSNQHPYSYQIVQVEVGFCQNVFTSIQTDRERFEFIFGTLNQKIQQNTTYEIKQVIYHQFFGIQELSYPIIQFIAYDFSYENYWRSNNTQEFYIWNQDFLTYFDQWIKAVYNLKIVKDNKPMTISITHEGGANYCVCILENGNYQIRRLKNDHFLECLNIPAGQKVIAVKRSSSDRYFQYLCDNNTFYNEKGAKLFQLNGGDVSKYENFIWGDRSCLFTDQESVDYYLKYGRVEERRKIKIFVQQTGQVLDATEYLTPPKCGLLKLNTVYGTNKFQMILRHDKKQYSYIRQEIDSSQVMLTNPYLINQLSNGVGVSNIIFYKEKCIIQIKQHCLVYDCVTSIMLHYFELPNENYKLDIQDDVFHVGGSKYNLAQFSRAQYEATSQRNTFFLDNQYICVVSFTKKESSKEGTLILKKSTKSKEFHCEIVQDTENDALYTISTGQYIVWQCNQILFCAQIYSLMKELKRSQKTSLEVSLEDGQIIKLIQTSDFCGEKDIIFIQRVSEEFIDYAANDCVERNKKEQKRTEVIQIILKDRAVIWDLRDHEEIKVVHRDILGQKMQLVVSEYFKNNLENSLMVYDILFDEIDQDKPFENNFLRKSYTYLDIVQMQLQLKNTKGDIGEIELALLICKIFGMTFFQLAADKKYSKLIQNIAIDLKSKRILQIKEIDEFYYDKILSILLTKLDLNTTKRAFNPFLYYLSQYFKLQDDQAIVFAPPCYERSERETILEKTLQDVDKKNFLVLFHLARESQYIKPSDIINQISRLNMLLEIPDGKVERFMRKNFIKTIETKKLKTLEAQETDDLVSFSSNTSQLSLDAMKKMFTQAIQEPKGLLGLIYQLFGLEFAKLVNKYIFKQLFRLKAKLNGDDYQEEEELVERSYDVIIFENEFIEDEIIPFLCNTVKNHHHFEVEIIRILLEELSYPWSLFVFLFIPYVVYCAVLVYYFSYCLTQVIDNSEPGFLIGPKDAVGLRIVVLILSAYFLLIEIIQVLSEIKKYYLGIVDNFFYLSMLALNIWIITEHANGYKNCTPIRLSQIAAVEMLQLWYYFFKWFRIFDQTAVYVELIQRVVYNTRYFMIMLVLIFCAFGFATLVLDRQMLQFKDDEEYESYDSLTNFFFNSYTFNIIFGQYLLGLGQADTSNYNSNPSRQLLWIFYALETFLTQITFFNMLISVMSTTYEDVMTFSERNKLIMRTEIYSEYAGFLNLIERQIPAKFKKRYLYIARKETEKIKDESKMIRMTYRSQKQQMEQISKIETYIKDLNTKIDNLATSQDTKIETQVKDLNIKIDRIATSQDEQMKQILGLVQEIAGKK